MLSAWRRLRERAFYDLVIDELIPAGGRAGRALEIGCGAGELMQRLQRVGWDVEGVEWDAAAAEVARMASGCPVWVGDFREAPLRAGGFQLIVLNHVFEHLADPLAALGRMRELLAPEGRAVLVFPNPQSLGAKVYRSAWFHWDAPRHLVLPSVPALVSAAPSAGLRVARVRTSAKFAAAHSAPSRAYRAGLGADATVVGPRDQAFAFVERGLVALGLNLGEEAIVVLEKRSSPLLA
jgi:SAM-dependent methyltransferase